MYKIILILASFCLFLVSINPCNALGIGVFLFGSGGNSQYYSNSRDGNKIYNRAYGGGVVLDTSVARNKLFNYRLNIGGADYRSKSKSAANLTQGILMNTFGIGMFRSEILRFWFGLQVGGHYIAGKSRRVFIGIERSSIAYYLHSGLLWKMSIFGEENVYTIGGIDSGLCIGLNFNFGTNSTISLTGGARYGCHWGKEKRCVTDLEVPVNTDRNRIRIYGCDGFLTFSFIIRLSDRYSSNNIISDNDDGKSDESDLDIE